MAVEYLRLRLGQPEQVLEVARRLKIRMPSTYYGYRHAQARMQAWSFAGASSLDQVELVYRSLIDAMAEGQNFEQWRARVAAGEVPLSLPRYRLETIFRTTMQANYSRGLGERVMANVRTHPYLLYSAVNDSRTRPSHSRMHGIIRAVNDPWWNIHRPPNGYNCRCRVIALTEAQAKARGGPTGQLPPPGDSAPDSGWDYDPWADPTKGIKTALRRRRSAPGAAGKAAQVEVAATAHAWQNVSSPATAIAFGTAELDQILDAIAPAARGALTEAEALAVRAKVVERIREVHGAPVRARVDKATGKGAKDARAMVEEASEFLPASWVGATNAHGPLRVITTTGRGAHYSHNGTKALGKYSFGSGRKALIDKPFMGLIWANPTRASFDTALHEYVHRVQAALPSLDELFQAYHRQRTLNDRPRMHLGELVIPDQFLDPYFGRVYAHRAGAPLEMMTMSLQYLLDPTNPSTIREFLNKDPEFARFAIGVLLRWRP